MPITPTMQQGAPNGIKVLDFSRILAGSWCAQMLLGLRAEALKAKHTDVDDKTRQCSPPFIKKAKGEGSDQASYFIRCNRNKRFATIEIWPNRRGQALVRKMAQNCSITGSGNNGPRIKNYKALCALMVLTTRTHTIRTVTAHRLGAADAKA